MFYSRLLAHSAVRVRLGRLATSISRTAPVRLLALPQEDRLLLLRALPVVLFVRLGLWLVPVTRLHRLLTVRRAEFTTLTPDQATRLAWAITATSSRVPRATCLTRALALQTLLHERGSPSAIHLGVAGSGQGEVHGHAWLEWRGEVLIGGGELSAFRTVVTLHG